MGATTSKKANVPYKLSLEEKVSIHKAFHSMCMSRPPPVLKTINEKLFVDFCGFPGDLGHRLFTSLEPSADGELTFVNFANGLVRYTMGSAHNEKVRNYVKLFTRHPDLSMTLEELQLATKSLYLCSLSVMGEEAVPPNESEMKAICVGIFNHAVPAEKRQHNNHPLMTLGSFLDFIATYCPRILLPFEILIYEAIFMFNPAGGAGAEGLLPAGEGMKRDESMSAIKVAALPDFVLPSLNKESRMLKKTDRWIMLNALAHCNTYNDSIEEWSRLYSSDDDGHSFNRFCHHVFGYRGDTLLLVEDKKGNRFGAFVSEGWKDAAGFFANHETFLFNLRPGFGMFTMTGTSGVYCNTKTRNQPHGIGFGGDFRKSDFRFFISDNFEKGFVSGDAKGFDNGEFGPGQGEFEVAAVEVWGLAGLKAIEDQAKARKREEREIQRRRRIDRKAFAGVWDDESAADKFLLDLMGVSANNTAFLSPEELKQLTGKANKSESQS